MPLKPKKHTKHDFFIPAVFDSMPIKDDMATMEHPMFTLSKKKDMRLLRYQKDNITVDIAPSIYGLPSIFDKDVLLYCISQFMKEFEKTGEAPPRRMRISSRDLLVATNRPTNGAGYRLLKQALDRLIGVKVKTNIKTNRSEIIDAFGLLESYAIIESSRVKDRMIRLEITLSEWLYNSILGKEVLTISPDYFRLGRPLERRVYEIARKHCGKQESWEIKLENLLFKTGATSPLKKFRLFIREIVADDHLPQYKVQFFSDKDIVKFTYRDFKKEQKEKAIQQSFDFEAPMQISYKTRDKARKMTQEKGTGWDYYQLENEFAHEVESGNFTPDNLDASFLGFVKMKIKKNLR